MREEVALTTPLTFMGKVVMNDEGARKFIYVFSKSAVAAQVVDRGHVDELRFWNTARLIEELERSPENFSTTLPFVLGVAGIAASAPT